MREPRAKVYENMSLLTLDHRSRADRCRPSFFGAFHALTIDDGGGRAGLSLGLLATLHIKGVVDILQCAVVGPQVEIVVDRALRSDIVTCRGRTARDSSPSTWVTPSNQETTLESQMTHKIQYLFGRTTKPNLRISASRKESGIRRSSVRSAWHQQGGTALLRRVFSPWLSRSRRPFSWRRRKASLYWA
jgi:hypothetical protein